MATIFLKGKRTLKRTTSPFPLFLMKGNKDPQRGLSAKGTDVNEDNKSKQQTQTQDACTLKPTYLTSINSARMEQDKVDMVSNDRHGEHSKETYPTKKVVNKSSQSFPCSAVSGEDPTHSKVIAVPENSKEAPEVNLSKVNISRENNKNEQPVSSQSRNASTGNPYISRSVGQSESQNNQNEAVEESTSLNEGSHGSQCFGGTSRKPLRQTSCGTKNVEEGTSGPKNLSSSMQREIRDVKPPLADETRSFSLLSKSANMKASRPPQLTSETNMIKKINTHPTDLKREHKDARPEKSKIASAKTYCRPALQGLPTTSMNTKLSLEPLSAGNSSVLNAPSSTAHSTGHNILPSQVLLKGSNASDIMQGPSKDDKRPTVSQLTGSRIAKVGTRIPKYDLLLEKDSIEVSGSKGSHVTTCKIPNSLFEGKPALFSPFMKQKMPEESVPESKAPAVLKRIMRSPAARKSPQIVPDLGNQTILSRASKACTDNVVSSTMPCEMGDISDLELPALLENDGNVEKAEACRKQLEDDFTAGVQTNSGESYILLDYYSSLLQDVHFTEKETHGS